MCNSIDSIGSLPGELRAPEAGQFFLPQLLELSCNARLAAGLHTGQHAGEQGADSPVGEPGSCHEVAAAVGIGRLAAGSLLPQNSRPLEETSTDGFLSTGMRIVEAPDGAGKRGGTGDTGEEVEPGDVDKVAASRAPTLLWVATLALVVSACYVSEKVRVRWETRMLLAHVRVAAEGEGGKQGASKACSVPTAVSDQEVTDLEASGAARSLADQQVAADVEDDKDAEIAELTKRLAEGARRARLEELRMQEEDLVHAERLRNAEMLRRRTERETELAAKAATATSPSTTVATPSAMGLEATQAPCSPLAEVPRVDPSRELPGVDNGTEDCLETSQAETPPPHVAVGCRVTLSGLAGKPEYNGLMGTVISWDGVKGRACVKMDISDGGDGMKLFRPSNLSATGPIWKSQLNS